MKLKMMKKVKMMNCMVAYNRKRAKPVKVL